MKTVAATIIACAACALPPAAGAQMLGVPVLQNAFANPGITVAGNYGSGSGSARGYGGAAAWSPPSAGFQISAGLGSFQPGAGAGNNATYGARLMVPVWHFLSDAAAAALFAGYGGGKVAGVNESFFPVGVSVGWRHSLGATRAFSVYAAPFYGALHVPSTTVTVTDSLGFPNTVTRTSSVTHSDFYASVGADVAVLPQLGLTLGYQAGGASWSKGVFGVALSYALSRR